ncbi:MAG: RNA polymerase sigma factor [Patescibacteria group bacterium]
MRQDNFEMESEENDPRALMRLAKEGDSRAFKKLYRLYFTPIFRYVYFRVKTKEIAEDLTQEVFLKVYRSLAVFKAAKASPLAYFFTVARNTVIDYWKKKKDVLTDDLESLKIADKAKNPAEITDIKIAGEITQKAIKKLTEEQQEVIVMKFISDLPNKEIANLLSKTEEAVRQIQCRALKALRQELKELNDYL